MDSNPVERHAISSSFMVEMVSFHKDVLHGLMLVMSSPVLMIVGVSVETVILLRNFIVFTLSLDS